MHFFIPYDIEYYGRSTDSRWSNPDLDPVEPKYRVWSSMTYLFFWISASLDPQNFTKGSSLVSTGMSWQQAFGTALVAQFIAALYIVFLSRPASKTHVGKSNDTCIISISKIYRVSG